MMYKVLINLPNEMCYIEADKEDIIRRLRGAENYPCGHVAVFLNNRTVLHALWTTKASARAEIERLVENLERWERNENLI